MSGRLAAHVEAASLIRRAEQEGGFATVLRRGDAERGSLLLLVASRGIHHACLERALAPGGTYRWQKAGPAPGSAAPAIADWVEKRTRFDEDSWLIELDIAEPERFIDEMVAQG